MMTLKLDTGALQSLMTEDDGNMKLELQQAVIEEFSRRHIKAIANNVDFKHMIKQTEDTMKSEIEKLFGDWTGSYSNKKFVLN